MNRNKGFAWIPVLVVIGLLIVGWVAYMYISGREKTWVQSPSPVATSSIAYTNAKYGFKFSLPDSWHGYSVVETQWEGRSVDTNEVVAKGPLISLRHPDWLATKPRQDIPIMIFTTSQWNLVLSEKMSVSAAPIGPSELGRNSSYVFALPARYNYAFPIGYEEVDRIIQSHSLQAF